MNGRYHLKSANDQCIIKPWGVAGFVVFALLFGLLGENHLILLAGVSFALAVLSLLLVIGHDDSQG